ncbi:MAG: TIGR04255 family protein, partial [Planctomycetales bacterium]|nr:TIGR04255 family protein [Planctomycetales bacterium]
MAAKYLPQTLSNPPLVETVTEFRFHSLPVPELMPRVIAKFANQYPSFEALPAGLAAPWLEEGVAVPKYAPAFRFSGGNGFLAVGKQMMAIGAERPYSGWEAYRAATTELLSCASAELVGLQAIIMRYTNMLPPAAPLLSGVNCSFAMDGPAGEVV